MTDTQRSQHELALARLAHHDREIAALRYVDDMTAGWIEAALFTAQEEVIPPKSGEFDTAAHMPRVSAAFKRYAQEVCCRFYSENSTDLADYPARNAGHDLYYTTNRHGVGFWEGDHCTDEQGERLTAEAHKLPECTVYKQRGWYGID